MEVELDLGLGEEPTEIAQISDIHFNYCLPEKEEDEEVNNSRLHRIWLANGSSVSSALAAMDAASYCDQTVVTGDTVDYLSKGALELTVKHIFERDPSVICTLGGHDITKQMQTGQPNKLSVDERLDIIRSAWIHDIFYYSRDVGSKVIAVGLDNGQGIFHPMQVEKLKADICRARNEGKIILIFQHEPLSTGKPEDNNVPSLLDYANYKSAYNFYDGAIMCAPEKLNGATAELYSLICENADVIRAVFNGHLHAVFYTEIKASYKDADGNAVSATIPQYTATANAYFKNGIITRIIVK